MYQLIRKAVVVKPHKKRKVVLSQTQVLNRLAGGMTKIKNTQKTQRANGV